MSEKDTPRISYILSDVMSKTFYKGFVFPGAENKSPPCIYPKSSTLCVNYLYCLLLLYIQIEMLIWVGC